MSIRENKQLTFLIVLLVILGLTLFLAPESQSSADRVCGSGAAGDDRVAAARNAACSSK